MSSSVIETTDKSLKIYKYGTEIFISSLVNIAAIVAIGILTFSIKESVLFMLLLVLLRIPILYLNTLKTTAAVPYIVPSITDFFFNFIFFSGVIFLFSFSTGQNNNIIATHVIDTKIKCMALQFDGVKL